MPKKTASTSNIEKYGKQYNPLQIVRERPDTFVGSVATELKTVAVYNPEVRTVEYVETLYNDGLFAIIREIVSNAIDNVWRSTSSGSAPVKKIEFTINLEDNSIGVWNDGYCIPVHKVEYDYTDPETGDISTKMRYPAEIFFGGMFSGTNYDDTKQRKTSGRNGMGSTVSMALSKKFKVVCSNPEDKKIFEQVYECGGKKKSQVNVKAYRPKTGFTYIEFIPDLEYFNFTDGEDYRLTPEFVRHLHLYAHEAAMITKVLTKFTVKNGNEVVTSDNIKIASLDKFSKIYFSTSPAVQYLSPCGDECVIVDTSEEVNEVDEANTIPHHSYVNGIRTAGGGIHVAAWQEAIVSSFVRAFNSRKPKKGDPPLKTTAKMVYPYLHAFIRTEVDRPKFASQTKDRLTEVFDESGKSVPYKLYNPRSKNEKEEWMRALDVNTKKLLKLPFVKALEEKLLNKLDRTATTKTTVSKKRLHFEKLSDANKAGGKEALMCTLHATEGDSAKAFVIRGTGGQGRDYHGVYAMRGKPMNAQNYSDRDIFNNKELSELSQTLGLRKGVDYSIESNFQTLRYGKFDIVTDQDDDGFHIRGALINFIYKFWSELFDRGFVTSFSTPVVVVKKKGGDTQFYSNPEFRRWYEDPENAGKHKGKIHYYKGLASINPKDVPGYFRNKKIIVYVNDDESSEYMELGFNKNFSDARKPWITKKLKSEIYSAEEGDEGTAEGVEELYDDVVSEGELCLSKFVDTQLSIYHCMTPRRALPCIWDGLKESQRKILYSIIVKNPKTSQDLEKVSGFVKDISAYHHGSASLQGAIAKMTQGFVGSNNIPLLVNDGETGTRLLNGGDAGQGRYVQTRLEKITRVIFHPDDDALLEHLYDNGSPIEYKYFMPILPMLLVNGSEGIASGFSTSIPCHNPLDIVDRIERWLDGEEFEDMELLTPWYRGFKGGIKFNTKKDGWVSEGILEKGTTKKDSGWWHIRELPIGMSINSFKLWLGYLETGVAPEGKKWKKKSIKGLTDIKDYCGANSVHFMIKPTKDFMPDMNTTGNLNNLRKKHSLKNMVAVDGNDYPYLFENTTKILEVWCPKRLEMYARRRKYLLSSLRIKYKKALNKYKYIRAVIDRKINMHQKTVELEVELSNDPWNFDRLPSSASDSKVSYEYLLSMQMRSMTVERLADLKKEAVELRNVIGTLKSKTHKDLWREDLINFKTEYPKYLKGRCEE